MAHQIEKHDNMLSVKETPWHGLGTVLDGAPSIDEALTASGLDWEVKTVPVFAQLPKMNGKSSLAQNFPFRITGRSNEWIRKRYSGY